MRVLVLREESAAARTATALVEAGHVAIVAPLTRIVPTGAAAPPGHFDALLATSRNALPALRESGRGFAALPVFAVGTRTAEELGAAGFAIAAAAPDAGRLAAIVRRELRPGRLLHVAGRERKAEPAATLTRSGFTVAVWEAYAAAPVERLPALAADALAAGGVDAVLHYSGASAATALRLIDAAGLMASLLRVPQLCLSADVAGAFAGLGAETRVAAAPDEASLLALLKQGAASGRARRPRDLPAKDGAIAPGDEGPDSRQEPP